MESGAHRIGHRRAFRGVRGRAEPSHHLHRHGQRHGSGDGANATARQSAHTHTAVGTPQGDVAWL